MQISLFYAMIMQAGKFFKNYGLVAGEKEPAWKNEVWRAKTSGTESIC